MGASGKKVLLLFNCPYSVPRGYDFKEEFSDPENMYTENDVYQALRTNGYNVRLLGIHNDLSLLFEEVREDRPDVIFNLVEVYNDDTSLEKHIGAVLEMIGIPYTGASPVSLFLCNDKALSKKILSFHRIRVPKFRTFFRGHRVWHPKDLSLPCVIKPLCEEASRGISQASVVDNPETFCERIGFIHENMNTDAIAEEYIDGREFYVSVFGHKRLEVWPLREMKFGELPQEEPRIATYKAKWDDKYRARWNIFSGFAAKLADGVEEKLRDVCKRAYRALQMDSYTRFDARVTADKQVCIIEANANPCIARIDEVAQSAQKAGISYENLIDRIVRQALKRAAVKKR